MCGIHQLGAVNDTYGHAGGKQVMLGATSEYQRGQHPGLHGGSSDGSELCVLLPRNAPALACEVAECPPDHVANHQISSRRDHSGVRWTMCSRFSEISRDLAAADTLIDWGGQALYHAATRGQHRIAAWLFQLTEAADAAQRTPECRPHH
jgi:GGDEF domain-containing protein